MKRAAPGDIRLLVAPMAEVYAEAGYDLSSERASEAFETILADERPGSV
jgi:hypothetical protein